MQNLNNFQIDNDGNFIDKKFIDNSILVPNGTCVYFRDLEQHLISHIQKADVVLGAVAWLTNYKILDALAKLDNVSIIVQKEDFLRPDSGVGSDFKKTLRKKYDALSCNLTRYEFENILNKVSICSDPSIDSIRCVGNHNKDKQPAFPRMHNKFLIFANLEEDPNDNYLNKAVPYAVWTGSFNLTKNATESLENAIYFTEKEIVNAYFQEYGQIAAMSEKLDWISDWSAPEWRIGT